MTTIVQIIAKATDCMEFEAEAMKYIDNNQIPPMVLDFWIYGAKTSLHSMRTKFMERFMYKMKTYMKEPKYLETPETKELLTFKTYENLQTFKGSFWNFDRESENTQTFPKYTPALEQNTSLAFHALMSHPSFEIQHYQQDPPQFALHVGAQPACNNRGLDINFASDKENGAMWEYMINLKTNESFEDNSSFQLSDGHYILAKRCRRENIADDKKAKALAPFCHLWAVAGNSNELRESGVKFVGDPVDVACEYKDMCALFKLLTVSTNR